MLLLIGLLLVTLLLDILVYASISRGRPVRYLGVLCALAAYGAVSAALICGVGGYAVGTVLLFAYRGFNLARVLKDRMHRQYLHRLVLRTGLWLAGVQLVLLALAFWLPQHAAWHILLPAVLLVQSAGGAIFLMTTYGHAARMRQAAALELIPSADLPSITVAIPARNETTDLYDCIQSLLTSQYPKLEILVLDDCSQTRRTPEIIRGFAHDGVRFISGEEPNDSWLPKNQAYERLSRFANGEYIIFAGVDIRFEASALRRLVSYALIRRKEMVCVMPLNLLAGGQLPIIQPMRYAWELVWPRKLVNKPPVLSSCWLVRKQALEDAGGFKAAARMVVPEAHFARELSRNNGYSFVSSGLTFGVTSMKSPGEQRNTAIRVGYPSTHRRPESVALITLGYIAWIAVPLLGLLYGLFQGNPVPVVLVALICALHTLLYAIIFRLAYNKIPLLPVASLPLAALVYVGLLNYSMYKYEFSEVTWKGRNVCLPVMRVVPHLPDL